MLRIRDCVLSPGWDICSTLPTPAKVQKEDKSQGVRRSAVECSFECEMSVIHINLALPTALVTYTQHMQDQASQNSGKMAEPSSPLLTRELWQQIAPLGKENC